MATPVITPVAQFINNCSDKDVYAFIHKIIDVCCDKKHLNEHESVLKYLNDPNFVDKFVPSVWPTEPVFQDVVLQFAQVVRFLGYQLNNVEQSMDDLPVTETTKLIIQECLNIRHKELLKAIIFKTITFNLPYLKTFDWQVKVVMSSNQIVNVKVPILQLDLLIESPNGKSTNGNKNRVQFKNKLSIELTKEELITFIQTLEEAKQNFDQVLTV